MNKMKWMKVQWFKVRSKTDLEPALSNTPCKQIRPMSRIKTRGISPVGKEKVYGGNDLPKSQVLSSEWKTERVREDASGDREDGEEDDDELPCVIGESEGDCVWRGSRRSVGSSFHGSLPKCNVNFHDQKHISDTILMEIWSVFFPEIRAKLYKMPPYITIWILKRFLFPDPDADVRLLKFNYSSFLYTDTFVAKFSSGSDR